MRVRVPPRPLDKGSLWLLTIAPSIWAAHLLLSYVTAAVWCARFARPGLPEGLNGLPYDATLGGVRTAITWYTVAALIGIAVVGYEGLRRHSHGTEATTHDLDSPEDRHRFLGFATILLAGLSAVAVLYAALAATFFETCR